MAHWVIKGPRHLIPNLHVVVLETEWLISPKASIQAKRELKAVPR